MVDMRLFKKLIAASLQFPVEDESIAISVDE
jgi:hypothetical protein